MFKKVNCISTFDLKKPVFFGRTPPPRHKICALSYRDIAIMCRKRRKAIFLYFLEEEEEEEEEAEEKRRRRPSFYFVYFRIVRLVPS